MAQRGSSSSLSTHGAQERSESRASALSRPRSTEPDGAADDLAARWRASLSELKAELAAERGLRMEAELVLQDTTAALSELRETSARAAAVSAAHVLAGGAAPVRPPAGGSNYHLSRPLRDAGGRPGGGGAAARAAAAARS